MDYLKFENWKNSHVLEMEDITLSKPDDIFIYTRFTVHFALPFEYKRILFAETLEEAIGYLRYIFIYDILTSTINDLETEYNSPFNESQKDTISLMNFWYKLGKIPNSYDGLKDLMLLCNEFNLEYSQHRDIEYEICILNGADNLRNFLNSTYSSSENFDMKRLEAICKKETYSGKRLKEFIEGILC